MKTISLCGSAVVFAGFFWAATLACTGPDQAQTSTKPDPAAPPQTKVQATPNPPKKKPVKSSEWHHFGERDSAPVAGHIDPGVWHHYSPDPRPPQVVPGGTAPVQEFGMNRPAGLERQMWALINRDRLDPATSVETRGRAQPLRWNEKLAAVARGHSRDMVAERFFDHVDPEGRTLAGRINSAGIPWRALGENIAITGTVSGAEATFMNEPRFQSNHRSNILNTNYTDVGIGIVPGPNGSLYITQDFAAIPPN